MINFNSSVYSIIFILSILIGPTLVAQGINPDSMYIRMFQESEVIAFDLEDIRILRSKLNKDTARIGTWSRMAERARIDSFYIPMDDQEVVLKQIFKQLKTGKALGAIIFGEVNKLDELRFKLLDIENIINLSLFPYEEDCGLTDNEKIGFVNSLDFISRTVKFLSYEGNPSKNGIAYFNKNFIKPDTIKQLDSVIDKTLLTKIRVIQCKVDKSNPLSVVADLDSLDSLELIDELNILGDVLNKRRKDAYQKLDFDNEDIAIVRLFDPQFNIQDYTREEIAETLRRIYYAFRKVSMNILSIDEKSLVKGKTYKDISLQVMCNNMTDMIDPEISFVDFCMQLNINSLSEATITKRIYSNAFGKDLYSIFQSKLFLPNDIIVRKKIDQLLTLTNKVSLLSYQTEKDAFELFTAFDSLHIELSNEKIKYYVRPEITLSWTRGKRTSLSHVMHLDGLQGEIYLLSDVYKYTKDDVSQYLIQEGNAISFWYGFIDSFKLNSLKEIGFKSIIINDITLAIDENETTTINLEHVFDFIANGSLTDGLERSFKEMVINKIKGHASSIQIPKELDEISSIVDNRNKINLANIIDADSIDFQKKGAKVYKSFLDRNVLLEVFVPYTKSITKENIVFKYDKGRVLRDLFFETGEILDFDEVSTSDSAIYCDIYFNSAYSSTLLGRYKYNYILDSYAFTPSSQNLQLSIHGYNVSLSNVSYQLKSKTISGKLGITSSVFNFGKLETDLVVDTIDFQISKNDYRFSFPKENRLVTSLNSSIDTWFDLEDLKFIDSLAIDKKDTWYYKDKKSYNAKAISDNILQLKYQELITEILHVIRNPNTSYEISIPLITNKPVATIFNENSNIGVRNADVCFHYCFQNLTNIIRDLDVQRIELDTTYELIEAKIKLGYIPFTYKLRDHVVFKFDLSVEGDLVIDQKQFLHDKAKEYFDKNEDVKRLKKELRELLIVDEEFIKITPLNQSLSNGSFRVDVDLGSFCSIKNIIAKRFNRSEFRFDYSNCKLNTDQVKDKLQKTLDVSQKSLLIKKVVYLPESQQIGKLLVKASFLVPIMDLDLEVNYIINLRDLNSKFKVENIESQLTYEIFKQVNDKFLNSELKGKKVQYGGVDLKIISVDVEGRKDPKLKVRSEIIISSIDLNASYTLTVNRNFKISSDPKDLDKLIAQQGVNVLYDKALENLKKQFSFIEEYINIDTIRPVYKLDKSSKLNIPYGIRVEANAKINSLFEVSLPPLLITADDVEVEGPKQIRFVYKQPIPLVLPFSLHDLGGTLSEKELSGEVKFVVGEPKAVRIDGTFRMPLKGDSRFYLNGDLILFDKFNLASSQNYLNINDAHFTSIIETSDAISDILYFKLQSDILGKGSEWHFDSNGDLRLFNVFDGKASLYISRDKTVGRLSLFDKAPIPLFPKLEMDFNAGYKFANPSLAVVSSVDIKGNKIAGVKGKISNSIAGVSFNFLGVELGITVPGYSDLDEDLIWELIKRLLNPDFKNLDKAMLALLGGNININPFADFGEGGDGIGGNGDSKSDNKTSAQGNGSKASNGEGINKAPYENGNTPGEDGKSNSIGYEGFAKLVQNPDSLEAKLPVKWEEQDGARNLQTGTKYIDSDGTKQLRFIESPNGFNIYVINEKGEIYTQLLQDVLIDENKYLFQKGNFFYLKGKLEVLPLQKALAFIDNGNLVYFNKNSNNISFTMKQLQISTKKNKLGPENKTYTIVKDFLDSNYKSYFIQDDVQDLIYNDEFNNEIVTSLTCTTRANKKGSGKGTTKILMFTKNKYALWEGYSSGRIANAHNRKEMYEEKIKEE